LAAELGKLDQVNFLHYNAFFESDDEVQDEVTPELRSNL